MSRDLQVVPVHQGLTAEHPGARAGGDGRQRVGGVGRKRLLTKHVLARLRRGDRPLGVQAVRKRVVDGVDVRISQEILVAGVHARDPLPGGKGLPAPVFPGGHRDHTAAAGCPHGRQELPRGDRRGPQDPPPHHACHGAPPPRGIPRPAPAASDPREGDPPPTAPTAGCHPPPARPAPPRGGSPARRFSGAGENPSGAAPRRAAGTLGWRRGQAAPGEGPGGWPGPSPAGAEAYERM